jgi:gliding motility-associated-like protein
MKSILILLFSFISLKGLSQTNLEMVPNGDFSQYDDYIIPASKWKDYFGDKITPPQYFILDTSLYYNFRVPDVYNYLFLGPSGNGLSKKKYLKGLNSALTLISWYPYADSSDHKINFDSIIFQDTFHFRIKDQYLNSSDYILSNYCSYKPGTNISKVRVCGKNLFPLTSTLKAKTKCKAYYSVSLDLMYDWHTYIQTLIYKGFINGSARQGTTDYIGNKFPELNYAPKILLKRNASNGEHPGKNFELIQLCNITLDSTHLSRNNNFKITLLNRFFKDFTSKDSIIVKQDIWNMPLFPDIYEEKHFSHRFKANSEFSFLQLGQKHNDSILYYPNDTLPFPRDGDSLFNLITDNGLYACNSCGMNFHQSFHPILGHWPYVKQWFYPGKFRRYADKALRNADYFLDNLSLKPEMYHQTPIAAPSSLCHKDTFLAFLPSGENATWTDLFTGEVLSQSDSCWIHLVDKVLIQVKGPNFTDTLKYSLEKPKSPFEKDIYSLCLGDSLNFVAEPGYTAQWQFGTIHSNNYTHHYTDTSVLQVTYNSDLGCEHHFTSTVIKGPNPNQFNIDTAFCNQQQFLWEIPHNNWVFIPQSGIVQNATHLVFNTARDVQMFVNLVDTLSNCPVSLDVNIRSNEVPDLDIPSDTTLCFSTPFDVPLPDAAWYRLDGTNINPPIIIDSTGNYLLIAGNRNCTDTAAFAIFKYPEIKVNIQQYNPWTCYLDSPLIFNAAPPSYQYYWKGSTTADSIYFTQDTQHIQLLVIDSHQCEKTYFVQPDYSCFKPVWIPNVFTPDGRGPNENERFAASCASCQTTYMRIYNRWGEMIYSGIEPWDGTYQGMLVPNGVYAYVIGVEISFGTQKSLQHFKGSVQVLR